MNISQLPSEDQLIGKINYQNFSPLQKKQLELVNSFYAITLTFHPSKFKNPSQALILTKPKVIKLIDSHRDSSRSNIPAIWMAVPHRYSKGWPTITIYLFAISTPNYNTLSRVWDSGNVYIRKIRNGRIMNVNRSEAA